MRFMRNWKARGLLASWVVWWIALTLWGLGPAIGPISRVSREGATGNGNISFSDGAFHASIVEAGKTSWQGDISFLKLILLAGIPPLIIWALWLRARRRP